MNTVCNKLLRKCQWHQKPFLVSFYRNLTSSPTIEEITIPNGHQYGYKIACKVWRASAQSATSDEPPIVCVHGWLDNAGSFDALIPKLIRPGRTFYVPDLPGHGLSSPIHTTHYNNHVESHLTIHRVVRHLKLDRFSLMGHSMGAEACVMYAGSFPQGIHKIVTIDGVCPNPHSWTGGWVSSVQAMVHTLFEVEDVLEKSPQADASSYQELLSRIMKARDGMVTKVGCDLLLKRGALPVPGMEGKFRFSHDLKLKIPPGMSLMTREQFTEFCAAVQAPTCVIKAAENDNFSKEASSDFQKAMEEGKRRNSTWKVDFKVGDGNHHVHLNDAENIAPLIDQFLS